MKRPAAAVAVASRRAGSTPGGDGGGTGPPPPGGGGNPAARRRAPGGGGGCVGVAGFVVATSLGVGGGPAAAAAAASATGSCRSAWSAGRALGGGAVAPAVVRRRARSAAGVLATSASGAEGARGGGGSGRGPIGGPGRPVPAATDVTSVDVTPADGGAPRRALPRQVSRWRRVATSAVISAGISLASAGMGGGGGGGGRVGLWSALRRPMAVAATPTVAAVSVDAADAPTLFKWGGRRRRGGPAAPTVAVSAATAAAPVRVTSRGGASGPGTMRTRVLAMFDRSAAALAPAAAVAPAAAGDVAEGGEHAHEEHGVSAAVKDALILLLTTVVIVPVMRKLNTSPILGFLVAGIVLGPNGLGLIRDVVASKKLAEFGVVFFLFEMGLELSSDKLISLGKDVFGLGTAQFVISGALMTLLSVAAGLPVPPAVVIGFGVALSSSAFVLQLLSERGEMGTRFGRATFGILLLQDLAVVPLLVVTPLLAGSGGAAAVGKAVGIAGAKGALALAAIAVMGKTVLEPVFSIAAKTRSSEAFMATILFVVLGTSALTETLGLSDTLGAFLAGVMLAETKYRHQVEADIKPFRGLLLGLFFITVGFAIDLNLAAANVGAVSSLVVGLLALKAGVIAAAGLVFGLSFGTALRTGLMLAQGGEFAFVIFGLANRVGVLPTPLCNLLLLVVALSMALTPVLAALGSRIANRLESKRGLIGARVEDAQTADARDFVMVAGYGRVGQSVCDMLDTQLVRYVAFDTSPSRVIEARAKGLPVFYGDACRPEVLKVAGVERARSIVVTLDDPDASLRAVTSLVHDFPSVTVFCRARDARQQRLLQMAGATAIVPELLEASLLLGGAVLASYGTPVEEVNALIEVTRLRQMEQAGIAGIGGMYMSPSSTSAPLAVRAQIVPVVGADANGEGRADGGGGDAVDDADVPSAEALSVAAAGGTTADADVRAASSPPPPPPAAGGVPAGDGALEQ